MPIFEGKSGKSELFEHFLQTSLKFQNQLIEDSVTRNNSNENLATLPMKYVKHQSLATSQPAFRKLVSNTSHRNLVYSLNEVRKFAKDAFGIASQAILEQAIYAGKPTHS